jgi:peptidyl-prolyl isomerase E (cyclophilin E)
LEDAVTQEVLHAVFVPFGPIASVSMPLDQHTQRTRGFGFVEFEEEDDAKEAIANMNGNI